MNLMDKKYFLFDGGFGTYYSALYDSDSPCEMANLNHADAVLHIHREYIQAGAQAIKSNTFAANTLTLGLEFSEVEELLAAGWRLACEAAAGTSVEVFADIGPIPGEYEEVIGQYHRILDTFIRLGAVHFVLETMNEAYIFKLCDYIRAHVENAFIIVSFAVGPDGYTVRGVPFDTLAQAGEASSADAFGFNCISGPAHLLRIATETSHTKLLSIMPNSGYPSVTEGRTVYIDNPRYFAEKMLQIHQAGAKILGGCCGTTPEHIRLTARLLAHAGEALPVIREIKSGRTAVTENAFAIKLLAGEKVIAVELDPPLDADCSHIAEAAPYLRDAGADAITVADSPLARARADSMMISAKIQREAGIQAIPHLTCRDHNTIGLKSILLGGSIEGVRNVLIVTGDPVPSLDRSEIKGVFSVNSYSLIHYAEHLNRDVFVGQEFFIGSALNINVPKFDYELSRALKKQENGAKFFLTQPIYTEVAVENFLRACEILDSRILAGIMPIASYKNAVFLNNEVPGIHIPEEIIRAMEGKTPEEVRGISLDYSLKIIKRIHKSADGYYLMTPLKKYRLVGDLIQKIKEIDP